MRIRFTADTDEARQGAAYKVGDTPTLSETSARRWLRRGVAVVFVEAPARPKLKINRPMMADDAAPLVDARLGAKEALGAFVSPPKQRGRPKKSA